MIIYYGFLGGVVRALVGLMKSKAFKRRFDPVYLLFTLLASGFIGMAASAIVAMDYRIATLAGYAGTDLLEGLYKTKLRMEK